MNAYFYYPNINHINVDTHVNSTSLDHWVLETFRKFKKYNLIKNVSIVDCIPEEGIIFFHVKHFPSKIRPTSKQYFVCFQVDIGRHDYAHFHIVHNQFQTKITRFPILCFDRLYNFTNTVYVDPWPIEGIVKRASGRVNKVVNVSFHGNKSNTPKEIHTEYFSSFLFERDMRLKFYFNPEDWNDFSETDLSLCIRTFSSKQYYAKPYLKLTNSLLANVPVLAGYESSSRYFNNKLMQIPLVKNYSDLLKKFDDIALLKYNPFDQLSTFNNISKRFNSDGVAIQWSMIIDQIERNYKIWLKSKSVKRESFIKLREITNRK
jgi:hypothetical protein